ncbi:SDR family oxidoreductase [Aerococcus agrisoli]|uniref:SDR family oxidoreductase n=1 Tax=Aerococcus agrisoli TaxID=2487350 RepID=A0A3N4G7E9_9LACT|nr:SDR family oxidoreductase [Aerococcus agrisoli]RPA58659.1 SDR family oxidoreductase [Aerococcus agrisoli]
MSNETKVNLSNSRVVIAGGTGSVGEGIVRAYLKAGAEVIVPSRSEEKIAEFKKVLGDTVPTEKLHLVVATYNTFDSAENFAKEIIDTFGPVDHVVASIGGWWGGKALWDTSEAEWNVFFTEFATSHMALAKAFVPRISAHGAYQLIIGASAIYPVQGSGIVSMQQAALLMMGKVLQTELGDQRRIFTHMLGVVNNRNRPGFNKEWISAENVGEITSTLSSLLQVPSRNFELFDKAQFDAQMTELGGL